MNPMFKIQNGGLQTQRKEISKFKTTSEVAAI